MIHFEPIDEPRVIAHTASGVDILEPEETAEERHFRILRHLPRSFFIPERDSDDEEEIAGPQEITVEAVAAALEEAAALSDEDESLDGGLDQPKASSSREIPEAALGRLAAAYREADQLMKLLALVRDGRQVQAAAREVLPSVHPPPPPPAALSLLLKRRQLEDAAAALERGASQLRVKSKRAARVSDEVRALRPHWRLLDLVVPAPNADAASAPSGANFARHTVRPERRPGRVQTSRASRACSLKPAATPTRPQRDPAPGASRGACGALVRRLSCLS